MESRRVDESRMETIVQMSQQDANLAGNVHGGAIMKHIDNTAGIVASRHSHGLVVTASIDRLDFFNPVYVGDLLRIKASINFAGNTSMEVGVSVEAENFITGETRHTGSAYLTFVAMDRSGKPRRIPKLILESEEDIRRNREALERKKIRMAFVRSMKE